MSIKINNYKKLKKDILKKADLLVVSKTRSIEDITSYYHLGERAFGENRSQELLKKVNLFQDIEWHFIGHLQKNKIKDVIPNITMLESLDSLELASEIEKYCSKKNIQIKALVEIHLAENDFRKTGLKKEDVFPFFEKSYNFPHIHIEGIMVMGPNTSDLIEVKRVFCEAHSIFMQLQNIYGKETIKTLSMGMSRDYPVALEEGSTEVRIGTYLFD